MSLATRHARPRAERVLLALTVAALLAHAWSFRFEIDDAYISFRYAENLVHGHGLVFNPGEAVEGYTNFAWVLLTALGIRLGIEPLTFARVLGGLASAVTLVLAWRTARRLAPDAPAVAAPVILAACGPLACWTFAGLETPLVAALVTGCALAALARRPLAAGVLALALAVTRPDGLLIGGLIVLASLVAAWRAPAAPAGGAHASGAPPSRLRARALAGALVLALGTGAHLLWRHQTYGAWLPNTFHAKTGDLAGQLRSGLPYLLDFLRAFVAPWIGVAVFGLVTRRAGRTPGAELGATLALIGAWAAYVALVGGDGLGMYRFFVPVLPLVVVAGVVLLHDATTALAHRRGATIAVTAAVCAVYLVSSVAGSERALVTAHMSERNLGGWKRAGDTLARVLPEGTTIALAPAGYIPYRTGLVTYDILGLTDPAIARRKMGFTIGYAGHEKHDGVRVLSRRPHYLLLGNVDVTPEARRSRIPPFRPELDIFRHPDFTRDYEQVSLALDGGGVLNCFRRRDLGGAAGSPAPAVRGGEGEAVPGDGEPASGSATEVR